MMPGSDPERRAQNLLEQFHKQEVEADSEYSFDSRQKLDPDPAHLPRRGNALPLLVGLEALVSLRTS